MGTVAYGMLAENACSAVNIARHGIGDAIMTSIGPLQNAARDTFLYALPLTEIANARSRLLGAGLPAGRFFLQKGLATPADRFVTTPNADTIYANAFIDLSQGPATLHLPPLGERYASVALMDMFSNVFAILGTRTTGQDGGPWADAGKPAACHRHAQPLADGAAGCRIGRFPPWQVFGGPIPGDRRRHGRSAPDVADAL